MLQTLSLKPRVLFLDENLYVQGTSRPTQPSLQVVFFFIVVLCPHEILEYLADSIKQGANLEKCYLVPSHYLGTKPYSD